MKQRKHSFIAGGKVKCKTAWPFLRTLNTLMPYDHAIALLLFTQKKKKAENSHTQNLCKDVLCHLALIQLHMTVAIFTHSCHDCP
jgi:hypothetical protein